MPKIAITLKGHTDGVLAAAFSPCGTMVASGGEDNELKLWSAADGSCLRSVKAHAGDIKGLCFSADGAVIFTAGWDKAVRSWRAADLTPVREAAKHTGAVNAISTGAGGNRLITGGDDGLAVIWDSANLKPVDTLRPESGDIKACALSVAGIAATGGTALKFWKDGSALKSHEDYIYGVRALAFSPAGNLLAAGTGMGKSLEVWDTAGFAMIKQVKSAGWVNSLAFSPDGKVLASGGGEARLWDPLSDAPPVLLEGHSDEVYCVAFSPDGKRLVSASNDGTLIVWEL
ncbi:MAG TPA: hypothetical protein DDW67_09760 [Elusimicrobia bacterium]|nr:hypothetical protein [Elusimicrobiota bacterium]